MNPYTTSQAMEKKGQSAIAVPKYRKSTMERITEGLEMDIRDLKIKTTWDFMKNFREMTYDQRIRYLSKEYSLSRSAVEKIISDEHKQ